MAARSPQGDESVEWFTAPDQVNHRRYEALRAFHVEELTYAQAAERFGYTRWAMVNLVHSPNPCPEPVAWKSALTTRLALDATT
jgi:predicted DNA-binding protein (UPF0251 family)